VDSELDSLWKTYEHVSEWIRFADTKASAIIGINAILIGFTVSNLAALKTALCGNTVLTTIAVFAAALSLASVYFSLRCLNPTLNVGEPTSSIYFAHIALRYNSAEQYSQHIQEYLNDQAKFNSHIASEIWANSMIAWKKYMSVTWRPTSMKAQPVKSEKAAKNKN
jgi:hypothetical protein